MKSVHYEYMIGYKSNIVNIPRENNWYQKVRPDTKDAIQWFKGWDDAQKDKTKD